MRLTVGLLFLLFTDQRIDEDMCVCLYVSYVTKYYTVIFNKRISIQIQLSTVILKGIGNQLKPK